MEYTRQGSPAIIDELRELGSYFDQVFGENKDAFHRLFDWNGIDLVGSDASLDTYIFQQLPDYRVLEFRRHRYRSFRYDYVWGEFRLLLQFLYLSLQSMPDEKVEKMKLQLLRLMPRNLEFREEFLKNPENVDISALSDYKSTASELVVLKFLEDHEHRYFVEGAKNQLARMLGHRASFSLVPEPNTEAFIILHTELLNWADHHFLEKDWALKYAYFFLSEFSKQADSPILKIQVPFLQRRSLYTDSFRFEMPSWFPGDETREQYEKRLKENLESKLESHFQFWGKNLNLDRANPDSIKRITRRKDPDFESTKWLICWNEGATYPQIASCFHRAVDTIQDGIRDLKSYDLPVRVGTRGRKKSLEVGNKRLEEIRSME